MDQLLDSNLDIETPQYQGYGSFGARFAAALIDGIILLIPGYIVGKIFGYSVMDAIAAARSGEQLVFGAGYYMTVLVQMGIGWAYFAYQESSEKQATIGKKALNLVVTDMNGDRLSFQQASIRFAAKQLYTVLQLLGVISGITLLSSLGGLVAVVGYCMQPFTPKKQALHDMIANTLVYKSVK